MTHNKGVRYIFFGQISLFVFLIVCMAIIPHFLFESNEGGVSNYGLYAKTIVPYTLAFGLSSLLTGIGAKYVQLKPLKATLLLIAILLAAVLLSTYPYKVNQAYNDIHQIASTILILVELIAAIWFGLFLTRNPISILILLIQFIGFGLGLMTHFNIVHLLFIAEAISSIAFGVLFVRTLSLTNK